MQRGEYVVIRGISQLVTADGQGEDGLGILHNVDVVVHDGIIEAIGQGAAAKVSIRGTTFIDPPARLVIPGFVDCHSHLVFGGNRSHEFALRLKGASYQEIAAAGGGILSTVAATRAASGDELFEKALPLVKRAIAHGTTTLEIKSGYGLSTETELKQLRVVQRLAQAVPIDIIPTFLGAHEFPAEHRADRERYIDILCSEMLPEVARLKLARFCDVFCEEGVYSLAQTERVLLRAKELSFELKLHVGEFVDIGGADLGIALGAASIDHLEAISDSTIERLRSSSTIPVLLPGTAFYLRLPHYPPARKMLDAGVQVAIGSDANPGSNMCENMQMAGSLACIGMRMLPHEVLQGLTINGARALRMDNRVGSLAVGKQADLLFCDAPDVGYLFYHYGANHIRAVMKRGKIVTT